MATIRIKAPDGYKLKNKQTRTLHSEVVTDEKNRGNYELVPDNSETYTETIRG